MASCKARFLLAICIIQLITVAERQVFDFLGYMWAPIIANIMHIVFVIIGCFGATQTGPKYIFTYSVWNTLWLAWNMFIICFYLEVGSLYKEKDYLNFGTGSVSWWESNGWGCVPEYATGATVDKSTPGGDVDTGAELGVSSSTAEPPMVYVRSDPTLYRERPISVKGCFMDYPIVEVAHSALQCFLAFGGIIGGVSILMQFYFNGCSCVKEDDSFDFLSGDSKNPRHLSLQPMYVSYTSLATPMHRSNQNQNHTHPYDYDNDHDRASYYSNPPHISQHVVKCRSKSQTSTTTLNTNSYRRVHHNRNEPVPGLAYSDRSKSNDSVSNTKDVPRSPYLLRTGSRSRLKNNRPAPAVHADQIRPRRSEEQPIARAKSQERLSQKRHTHAQSKSRPKSLCTNSSSNFVEQDY